MPPASLPPDFQQTVARLQAAMQSLVEGGPRPFIALTSPADDVTIFGALGVYKRGALEARQDTEFVASRFRGGTLTIEPFAMGVSGDLGYTVWYDARPVRRRLSSTQDAAAAGRSLSRACSCRAASILNRWAALFHSVESYLAL